jgi:hypothetical protein
MSKLPSQSRGEPSKELAHRPHSLRAEAALQVPFGSAAARGARARDEARADGAHDEQPRHERDARLDVSWQSIHPRHRTGRALDLIPRGGGEGLRVARQHARVALNNVGSALLAEDVDEGAVGADLRRGRAPRAAVSRR